MKIAAFLTALALTVVTHVAKADDVGSTICAETLNAAQRTFIPSDTFAIKKNSCSFHAGDQSASISFQFLLGLAGNQSPRHPLYQIAHKTFDGEVQCFRISDGAWNCLYRKITSNDENKISGVEQEQFLDLITHQVNDML